MRRCGKFRGVSGELPALGLGLSRGWQWLRELEGELVEWEVPAGQAGGGLGSWEPWLSK